MTSDYQEKALKLLKDYGVGMQIIRVGAVKGFPNDPNDKMMHTKYHVILKKSDTEFFETPFYGSFVDWKQDKDPNEYEILSALNTSPVYENMWEFGREYGYEVHSQEDYENLQRIYLACKEEYTNLLRLFGPMGMREICDLNF